MQQTIRPNAARALRDWHGFDAVAVAADETTLLAIDARGQHAVRVAPGWRLDGSAGRGAALATLAAPNGYLRIRHDATRDAMTDGTLEAQGASAQGLITALHYGDNIETPRNNAFRNKFAVTYKANPDVYAMQGYDAAQLLGAGLQAVKGDDKKRTELIAAMKKAQVDSPRGKFTLSAQHNPTQDFYVREVKGLYNVVTGVAVKGLADPGRGCKM